jgi:tetratricopeptide (TPR) repeat protein
MIQLGVLMVVAVGAFFITRAVAANNRAMSLRDAAEWYRRGQEQIAARQLDAAVDSFRRAAVRNRDEKRYALALADALTRKGEYDAARDALLALREAAPEDHDINLLLARLSAERSDVTEALRFFHNALYAPWGSDEAEARRQVRFELIRFLLTHDQRSRALSELVALATDLPEESPLHLDVAELFVAADDPVHALDQFERALRLSPDSRQALAGAGLAAFRTGDYPLARTYLHRAPEDAKGVKPTLELVDLVLSNDPLASRLGMAERRRRLEIDVAYARDRLMACLEQRPGAQTAEDSVAIQAEAQAFTESVRRQQVLDQDTVEAGVDLIERVQRMVTQLCGSPTPLDQALLLIGRRYGGSSR